MCYNQTKFVKNELYMEHFHGNGIKNLNSAVILNKTTPKKKFGARGWHKDSFLKLELNRTRNRFFKIKQSLGKNSECTVLLIGWAIGAVWFKPALFRIFYCGIGLLLPWPRKKRETAENHDVDKTLFDRVIPCSITNNQCPTHSH